ncbi:pescadillo [Tanacetum coccineum]
MRAMMFISEYGVRECKKQQGKSLAQLQDQLPSNELGAKMNLVVNATFVSENDEETRVYKTLFQNKTLFLGHEVPRESLLFVITSFGGVVSWEGHGAPFQESKRDMDINYVVRPGLL